MGIYTNGRRVISLYTEGRPIIAVYTNGEKIWPDISMLLSCYANGYWIDEYPWTDNTPWAD